MRFEGKTVFLVGCYRSGTTWLQLLLFQHPAVASSQETHLFNHYLCQFEASWKRELEMAGPRKVGLSATLSQAEFDELMRDCAQAVLCKIASTKPNAEVVVEKTPDHINEWELILRLFPNAYFLHVIRDPRSVVCSLRSFGRSLGLAWAPTNVVDAARFWRVRVQNGRRIAEATERYKEVFYEKLLTAGPDTLQDIFTWLGLKADRTICEGAIAACAIDNLRRGSPQVAAPWPLGEEPSQFYRHGRAEDWVNELSRTELRRVEYITGDVMDELQYPRATPPTSHKPPGLVLRDTVAKALIGLLRTMSANWPSLLRTVRHMLSNR